jgi:streptogramin lyase
MVGVLAGTCSAQLLYDPGDLIVTNTPYTGMDVPDGILAVHPTTGDQDLISAFGLFVNPLDLRIAPGGNLIVLDGGVAGGSPGAVISVDPNSSAQTALTTGGLINNPNFGAVQVDSSGNIYVGLSGVGIIQVDPTTGNQTVVSGGFLLSDPSGLASTPDGNLYVGDFSAFNTGALLYVDINSGAQYVVATHGFMNGVVDIAVEPSGTVLVASQNNIVRVDPTTGTQILVTSDLVGLRGIAVGSDGQIYVSSNPGAGVASSILQIDPDTGNQTVISSGGGFGFLGGLVQAP